ncbi:MAG: hypothetical protein M1504_01590 [Candidatus Marsarchaeota archaeon]|nr:hypothetical protein [Candidatus Marsarchaeota archaeon]
MGFKGVIIEESLDDKRILKSLKVTKTVVEKVTKAFGTPWLKKWTLDYVDIPEEDVELVSTRVSKVLSQKHRSSWYADFKNGTTHYIIFKNKVFKIDRVRRAEYMKATKYGLSLGIPAHQVNFSANVIRRNLKKSK